MRWKTSAGVLTALAFFVPAAPAAAQTEPPAVNAACQTVERKVYQDIRKLLATDLDAATDTQVRILANQIYAAAERDSLPVLPDALQKGLDGAAVDLRAFLKTDVLKAWTMALRVSVVRTLTDAGKNVDTAAQKVLRDGAVDVYLAYLNDGLYAARTLDCAAQPVATPSGAVQPTPSDAGQPVAKPSGEVSVPATGAPTPASSAGAGVPGTAAPSPNAPGGNSGDDRGGKDGGLPVTGSNTGAVAGVGGALLLLGGVGYLIGRRRRSRFVA
ncbi:LPXTG cell wall anchor domain-containing protein [Actinoplanes sp. NPDC051859]|uniref:LPXTG cell wall anchor domain-containing protein n=1 Tax=Actinoplanes sp. NPDC051859 TaxID=3363909 RepID=UPI0037B39326